MHLLQQLRGRKEWTFFAALPAADRPLAIAWWAIVVLHGLLPTLFAIAMGVLVAAVQRGEPLALPLTLVGAAFVLLQVLTPLQTAVSHNLGDRTSAYLYDRLTTTCLRHQGIAHLEDSALAADLTVARDFDLGMTGPPLSYSMDFIASGLVGTIGGLVAASRPVRLCLVGTARSRGRVVVHALAAAGKRGLVRPQHRGRAPCAARRRIPLSPRGGSAGEQGASPLRARGVDDRALRREAHAPPPAAVPSDPSPREAAGDVRGDRRRREHSRSAGACVGGGRRPHHARRTGGLRAVRRRYLDDRVRRYELGARRTVLGQWPRSDGSSP